MDPHPNHSTYDVVIIGGAMLGSSTAWYLMNNPDFRGRVLVVERDPSYEMCSTAHTNSCIRQQFSNEINVKCSQYAAHFIKNIRDVMGDARVPELHIQSYGYLYLADTKGFADVLRANLKTQAKAGAATRLCSPEQIARDYPFYNLDDIILGSHNLVDEGYWDGGTVFDWFRRLARERGAEYVANEVVAMTRNAAGDRIDNVTLKSGQVISCGSVVNASGPRALRTAQMAGLDIPVEPRKRYSFIFTAQTPLEQDLPLTIDPSGVHLRQDGPKTYLTGCAPDIDPGVDYDDFTMDHAIWQEKVWPAVAHRIPQFEAIRQVTSWVGHYAYNTLDQNAIIGAHDEVGNFMFLNGFSGHGLQQSPAMGRGMSELLTYGGFQTLDLNDFSYDRIRRNEPFLERAII